MIITLGQARKHISEFAGKAGKCAETEDVRLFVMEVVQRLLHQGAHGNYRKWCFHLCRGCFTAPSDMEVPLKVKIDGFPEKVWSQWYEFYDVHSSDLHDPAFKPGLFEEVNTFYTVYDLPAGGARIAAIPLQAEKESAYITIQGTDTHDREVFTVFNGERIHGERIKISVDFPVCTQTIFKTVTGVEKSETGNYVRLYWQRFSEDLKTVTRRGLLAEYRPTDTHPSFRRFRVPEAATDCCVKVTVLGRVKDPDYKHDNDILPITSLTVLRQMAQLRQAENNTNLNAATYQQQALDKAIEDENQYYRTGGDPFDFNFEKSPGSNENLQ